MCLLNYKSRIQFLEIGNRWFKLKDNKPRIQTEDKKKKKVKDVAEKDTEEDNMQDEMQKEDMNGEMDIEMKLENQDSDLVKNF